jgi:hypothetical protein
MTHTIRELKGNDMENVAAGAQFPSGWPDGLGSGGAEGGRGGANPAAITITNEDFVRKRMES